MLAIAYPTWLVAEHVGDGPEHRGGHGEPGDGASEPTPPPRVVVLEESIVVTLPGGVGNMDFQVPGGYVELLIAAMNASGDGLVRLEMAGPGGRTVLHDGVWQDTSPWRAPADAGLHRLSWDVTGRWSARIVVTAQ